MTDEEKLTVVRGYVQKERRRRKIKQFSPGPEEGSCFADGEFKNLVERQLVLTREGQGAWYSLNHPEILEGAYRYVIGSRRF